MSVSPLSFSLCFFGVETVSAYVLYDANGSNTSATSLRAGASSGKPSNNDLVYDTNCTLARVRMMAPGVPSRALSNHSTVTEEGDKS